MPLYKFSSTQIIIEKFTQSGIVDKRRPASTNTPIPPFGNNIASAVGAIAGPLPMTAADFPNKMFTNAKDVNRIREYIRSMSPKKVMELIELSECAEEAIAEAILDLESGSCKTFSSIDELLEDLESD